ncbi:MULTISPECIES: hypothetical protein [Halorussus]|uniref:hypothetical protein n=1 Tax=Halorussus TaxID=1070314 RepID=UPI0020A10D91|nr:hypothetical protein [Halorussus vallis]USZ78602.1 hypothetical protein NGM07_24960 [Halorussus vallis]
MSQSKSSLTDATGPRSEFALPWLTGPAIVAGARLLVGDTLVHDEHGTLEVRGYGFTNGALGEYVKLAATSDMDAPSKWSVERGAPNSLPEAFDAAEMSLGGETE